MKHLALSLSILSFSNLSTGGLSDFEVPKNGAREGAEKFETHEEWESDGCAGAKGFGSRPIDIAPVVIIRDDNIKIQ